MFIFCKAAICCCYEESCVIRWPKETDPCSIPSCSEMNGGYGWAALTHSHAVEVSSSSWKYPKIAGWFVGNSMKIDDDQWVPPLWRKASYIIPCIGNLWFSMVYPSTSHGDFEDGLWHKVYHMTMRWEDPSRTRRVRPTAVVGWEGEVYGWNHRPKKHHIDWGLEPIQSNNNWTNPILQESNNPMQNCNRTNPRIQWR